MSDIDPNEVPAPDDVALGEYLREVANEGLDDYDPEVDNEV